MKPDKQDQTEGLKPLPAAQGSAANVARAVKEEEQILAVIKLPLPVGGFIGCVNGILAEYEEAERKSIFIRNCPGGYEVFRMRPASPKQQNDQAHARPEQTKP